MHTLIVILAEQKDSANTLARQMQALIDGTDNGERTFDVPLFAADAPDDSKPLRYWCAVAMRPDIRSLAGGAMADFPGSVLLDYDLDADPGFPQQWLAENGLRTARFDYGGN